MKVGLEIERGRVETGKSMKNRRHVGTACRLPVVWKDSRGPIEEGERLVSLISQ